VEGGQEDHGEGDEEVDGGKREGEEVCEGSERALKGGRRCVDRYRPRVGCGGCSWDSARRERSEIAGEGFESVYSEDAETSGEECDLADGGAG
jgi:hypothetical protein